jgi:hypothetical protein
MLVMIYEYIQLTRVFVRWRQPFGSADVRIDMYRLK